LCKGQSSAILATCLGQYQILADKIEFEQYRRQRTPD
jgi:hypothetical protein